MSTCTETLYIQSATTLLEKVTRYDAIIAALGEQVLNKAAGNSDVVEYEIQDGQVKIRTEYRSVTAIGDAIIKFERLRNLALNQLNGRQVALRSRRGLT